MDEMRWTPAGVPAEVLHLWGLLLGAAAGDSLEPGVPLCGACASQAFEDLAPPEVSVRLLKCLRCGKRWLLAGDKVGA
jgi:hypothetical protein